MLHQEKIKLFNKMPKYPQRSNEWKEQRKNYLTASTIASALGISGKVARYNLLMSKVTGISVFNGNVYTHWGNKYEPIANELYSLINNTKIHEFGMITNENYPILGVSPDGICDNGRMLEIKCPYSRVINGDIKKDYHHQMQEQMVVCDYDECDFLECKFIEIDNEEYIKSNTDNKLFNITDGINILTDINTIFTFGIVIAYVCDEECCIEYSYSSIKHNFIEQKIWYDNMLTELGDRYLYKTYWKLEKYNQQLVKRDKNWIIKNYPILIDFWKEVLDKRIIHQNQSVEEKISCQIQIDDDEIETLCDTFSTVCYI